MPHSEPDVLIKRLDPGVPLPSYAHPGDAGADLTTAEDIELGPGERALVPTGIAIALPDGYAAFVHPRSGLAARHGVTLVNAPGTVDAGYRGEIKVTLLNTDRDRPVSFKRGDRIAQLVIQRVERATFHEAEVLPGSVRGDGGFGSTGQQPVDPPVGYGGSGGNGGAESPPMSRGGLGGIVPPEATQLRRVRKCFVGVVQQTLAATGRRMLIRNWPMTRLTTSRPRMTRPKGNHGPRAVRGTPGSPSRRGTGSTSAASRCRSALSTRSSSSWPTSTAPG